MEILQADLSNQDLIVRYNLLFEECRSAYIQQSVYWGKVIKDLGPDQPIFLICNDGGRDIAGLPLYLYKHTLGNILTSIPQAGPLGGIFCREGVSGEQKNVVYKQLLRRAIKLATDYGCIAFTSITNPLDPDVGLYEQHLDPSFIFENFTQYIPIDSVVKNGKVVLHNHKRRTNLNRHIAGCKAAGYTVQSCYTEDQLQAWYVLHQQRSIALHIEPIDYLLFYNIFKELVPKDKARLILVMYGGSVIAGGFHIRHCDIVDVFMLSMSVKYTKPSPIYLCIEEALRWSKSLGAKVYNWQSSPIRQGGVYLFKQQWDSLDRPYCFVTKLLCDIKRIQEIGLDNLKKCYKNHYVVPFGVFEKGFHLKYFEKGR